MDHIAQERPIVLADFFRHQIVEQSIHAKHELLMLLGLKGQVVHFFRVAREIEKLHVVVLQDFLQRLRGVESGWRVIASKLVTSVENDVEKTTLVQFRLAERRRGLFQEKVSHRWEKVISIHGAN